MALIKYTGSVSYQEYSLTGTSALWQPGQISDVSDSRKALLLGTGYFLNLALPYSSPIVIYNQYIGAVIPSLVAANAATYSQTGTLITVTSTAHNIPVTIHNGKTVYIGGATVTTGSAITAGLYSNLQVIDANTFTCVSPISQSASGTLTTQTSAVTIPGFSVTIPGGLMGPNGFFDVQHMSYCNASAGTKRMSFLYFTFSFDNPAPGSTAVAVQDIKRVQNLNSTNKQIAFATGSSGLSGPVTTLPVLGAINSDIDQQITAQLTLNTASDYMTLEHVTISVYYS